MAMLMDGRAVGQRMLDACAEKVKAIVAARGTRPCLATVLVGDDPASVTYTRMKRTRSEAVGMRSLKVELAAASTTEEVVARVAALAADPTVHGILVQHPVPRHVDERRVFETVPSAKDVDGLTLTSFGAVSGESASSRVHCVQYGVGRLTTVMPYSRMNSTSCAGVSISSGARNSLPRSSVTMRAVSVRLAA